MALGTGRDNAMFFCVTEVTGDLSVFTWICYKLGVLFGMAGQALCLELSCKDNVQRLMRIMAAHAVVQSVMFIPLMALAACGDIFRTDRAVAGVAIETIDLVLVGSPG